MIKATTTHGWLGQMVGLMWSLLCDNLLGLYLRSIAVVIINILTTVVTGSECG